MINTNRSPVRVHKCQEYNIVIIHVICSRRRLIVNIIIRSGAFEYYITYIIHMKIVKTLRVYSVSKTISISNQVRVFSRVNFIWSPYFDLIQKDRSNPAFLFIYAYVVFLTKTDSFSHRVCFYIVLFYASTCSNE
jgi:hypothetical protein